jgi:hypothetical protein
MLDFILITGTLVFFGLSFFLIAFFDSLGATDRSQALAGSNS